ncbi:DNA polymerase III subunit beta [Anaeromusa acidaminophila]|uniref:DNA polymerase III subunit beta n=1 Tax=Anaeromusa acidaminophila TaxID=81464 RepID=UPI000380CF55|nr:DNA polymerase III subunit beta [Anaeromusa acidaminophila]
MIKVRREELIGLLKKVQKGWNNKVGVASVSGTVLLKCTGTVLAGRSTDLSVDVQSVCSIEAGDEKFAVLVKGAELLAITTKMPEGSLISMEIKEDGRLLIKAGKIKCHLPVIAEELPPTSKIESGELVTIKGEDFKSLVKKTGFSIAKDESRPMFTGIYLSISKEDKSITAVATDTHRLAQAKVALEREPAATNAFIVPYKTMVDVASLIENPGDDIRIFGDEKSLIEFRLPNTKLSSRLICGKYPDYNKIIPSDFIATIQADTGELRDTMDRLLLFAKGENKSVCLNLTEDQLKLSTSEKVAEQIEEELTATSDGAVKIAFNGSFLFEPLKVLDCKDVKLSFSGPLKPLLLTPVDDNSFLCVLTPMRI